MRFMYVAVAALLLAFPARAREDCLRTLPVQPGKSVTYLAFGSSAGDRLARTMSCGAAESLRADLFVSGQAIDPNLLGNANQLRAKVSEIRDQLAAKRVELQNTTTRAAREAVLRSVKVTFLGAGLATATAGCLTTSASCVPALAAFVALYELAGSTGSVLGDLAQAAGQAKTEIDKLTPVLQDIEGRLNDNIARQSKLRYNAVFTEMCAAIKQQCL